jgi:ATP-binding protein involved in chromosome partitioning
MTARADLEQIRAAAGSVLDPEIGRPLADLGMVGPVSVGRGGRVRLQLRLTTESCPLVGELQASLEAAVRNVDGVRDVEFDVVAMPARERVELAERLSGTTAPLTGALGIGNTRVYAVASGKGGVGKSTVTANLAAALAATGKRVGVLDADVWGYSIPQLFGVRRTPVVLGELMLPIPAHGVALMSIGFFVNEEQPVVWRGPMLHKALQQFVADTYWGSLDALFVDLPPGTGDATLSLLQVLPDTALLVVTTPQTAAQVVASRVARMAAQTEVPIVGVIENMSAAVCGECGTQTAVFGRGGGARLAEDAGAPLLGQIPLDLALREAGDRGVPVVLDAPDAASARELSRIANNLPTPPRKFTGKALPLAVIESGKAAASEAHAVHG